MNLILRSIAMRGKRAIIQLSNVCSYFVRREEICVRTILHSDLNNFFASVECVYNPALWKVPMAVCGDPEARHGIVLAKNELAKRAGVQTAEPIWQARQKCAALVTVPPHFDRYVCFSRRMREIYQTYSDRVEPFGLDEAWLDVTGAGASGEKIASELRKRAKAELGLTISAGVSFNKVFAKLASDLKKPDATTLITAENYRQRIWPLPVEQLLFVGAATRKKLNSRNLFTIGDLALCPPEVLLSALGKAGEMLWAFANGLDNAPVLATTQRAPLKSVGNSVTLPGDLDRDGDVHAIVLLLSESVSERMRGHGLVGDTVCLSVRDCMLNTVQFQRKLAAPTAMCTEICACAMRLFCENYRWSQTVRSLGVSVGNLSDAHAETQLSLFPDLQRQRRDDLENTVFALRKRYGHFVVRRAALLGEYYRQVDPHDEPPLLPPAIGGGRDGF